MMSRRKAFLILILGAILIFLIYRPVINSYFLSEDYEWWSYVRGKGILEVLSYFISPPAGSTGIDRSLIWAEYRPLVGLSFWLNVNFSWMNPTAFHITNLIIHLGNYLLVVTLAYTFLKKKWPAILAGFLFIIFPFQSEAVAWSDGRCDSLLTLFYLISFYLFSKSIKSFPKAQSSLSLLFFILALTAKEAAVSLPLALMFYTVFNQKGNFLQRLKRAIIKTVAFWAVLIFYFIFRGFYVGEINVLNEASTFNPLFTRVATLYLIFLIISLVLFITMQKSKNFHTDTDKVKLMLFLAFLIGIFYLPTIWIPTQERYLYLPSVAVSIFIANLFFIFWDNEVIARIKFFRVFLALTLFFTSIFSVAYLSERVEDWRKASVIAQSILSDFRAYAKDVPEDSPIYFFNLPDSNHESYIFRAYLYDAIYYDSGKSFKNISVPSAVRGLGNSAVIIEEKNKLILESSDHYVVSMPNFSQDLPFGRHVIEAENYQILWENDRVLNLTLKKDYLGKKGVYFFKYEPASNKLVRIQ
ncbi:MAG: hypothetical protein Q8P89_03120 [bacterium]|nr:hypothetical protein [bacterium]